MNWFKQQLANVAGTQEPIYGPSAIQPVSKQAETTPYTELTKEHLRWEALEYTNVETQVFYFMSDEGITGMAQVIYSNVAGIRTTVQFNSKIFSADGKPPHLWCSDPVSNYGFDDEQVSFFADNVAITMNESGDSYSIKSAVNEESIVNLTFTRVAPGFQVGEDGKSYYGTDPANPWGSMRHAFWPRCKVEGSIITKEKEYDMKGRGLFIHALQGMKPHHAAARWNFANFQTPTYSAIMMEFTTPESYGSTVVNVGGIAKDGEIICAGSSHSVEHTEINADAVNDWPEPTAVKFHWTGKTKAGEDVTADLDGPLERMDRVDVMAEVPAFVKNIVAAAAGTKPYIYQYGSKDKMTLKLNIGGTDIEESGTLFAEATFIC